MPPLDRAVAFPERDHTAVGEPEDLHLDVPGALDVALKQDRGDAEEPLRAGACGLEGRGQAGGAGHRAHPDPAAPGGSLTITG